MHGVQVVDERLHGLTGLLFRILHGLFHAEAMHFIQIFLEAVLQRKLAEGVKVSLFLSHLQRKGHCIS